MFISRIASIPFAVKIALLFGAFLLMIAGAIHASSALPREYSWSRTIELFWQSMTDAYFVVMALVVLIAAHYRPSAAGERDVCWNARNLGLASVLTAGIVFALLGEPYHYNHWDLLALIPAALLFLHSLRGRHLGHVMLGVAAGVGALMIVSYVFTIFKSQLFLQGVILDEWLVAVERAVFGEPLYLTIAHWAEGHPSVVGFCDWVYYLFFTHMALIALFLFARGESGEQWRYITSLSLCYLVGGVSYYAFPALGPVYFDPGSFRYLESNAAFTVEIQKFLKQATDASIGRRLATIDTFAFVACMPSLHMAHETIMLFFSRRSPLMLLFSGLFWLSSCLAVLVLGWHYLLDVVAGVMLAWLVLGTVYRNSRYARPAKRQSR